MSKRPITVQAAAAIIGAEGLAALGFGAFTGVETAAGAAVDPASAIGITVIALAAGLGMLACARGLLRSDQWSRAPTVLTQLFALPVAWSLWQSERPAIAVPLGLVAVLALITVLSPPTTVWLLEEHEIKGYVEHDGDEAPGDGGAAGRSATPEEAAPKGARSLGQRLMDRLKVDHTGK